MCSLAESKAHEMAEQKKKALKKATRLVRERHGLQRVLVRGRYNFVAACVSMDVGLRFHTRYLVFALLFTVPTCVPQR